jgi:endonuclease-3
LRHHVALRPRPDTALSPAKREEIYRRLAEAIPNPKSELEFTTPFELLVAVVLSAQATDKGVNLATRELFKVANTPEKMAALGVEGLEKYIKTIGLYRGKAKNVIALSNLIREQHGGQVPRTREALEALPGVGRKTANVVLNVAFEELTIAVDTHVFRVANRTGLAAGKDPLEVEMKLMKVTPEKYLRNAHHYLILHGRYICIAKKPLCWKCPIFTPCEFPEKKKFAAMGPAGEPEEKNAVKKKMAAVAAKLKPAAPRAKPAPRARTSRTAPRPAGRRKATAK